MLQYCFFTTFWLKVYNTGQDCCLQSKRSIEFQKIRWSDWLIPGSVLVTPFPPSGREHKYVQWIMGYFPEVEKKCVCREGKMKCVLRNNLWQKIIKIIIEKSKLQSNEAFPGVLGNRKIRPFISGEQGNKSLKLKETGETKAFWGNREHRKSIFWLWRTRENAIFFQGNKGTGTTPRFPWEGLNNSSNTDGSFTMANSNLVFSPYEILPIAQENKQLGIFSYFIVKLYVVCKIESPHLGDYNEYTQHNIFE